MRRTRRISAPPASGSVSNMRSRESIVSAHGTAIAVLNLRLFLRKLKELKKPVVWVDADALIAKSPVLFETLDCDLAVRIDSDLEKSDPARVRTGTVYINYTEAGLKIASDWSEICQEAMRTKPKGHEVWDQIYLKALIHQGTEGRIESLPGSYCAIFDAQEDQENPVIIHYQASRLYKKFINGEVVLVSGSTVDRTSQKSKAKNPILNVSKAPL